MAGQKRDNTILPRYYRSIFIAAFFLAVLLILITQEVYISIQDGASSKSLLAWNVLVTLAVVLVVLLLTYIVAKQLMAKQAISEAKFRELAEKLPDPVFETDSEGKITFVNSAATNKFGYSKSELTNMTVVELMAESEKGKIVEHNQPIMIDVAGQREYIARRSDGTEFPMLVDSSLIFEGDMPVGLRGVVIEISELKRMEDELRRANAELKAYSHVVSHDLKNPLTAIKTSSETLEKIIPMDIKDKESLIENLLGVQHRAIERSERIITDLLAFAETQELGDLQPVDIGDVISEIKREKAALLDEKHASIKTDEELGTVVASPVHMYQLFSNLTANALKHNKPGVVIEISHQVVDGEHRYLFRDNGKGIPEAIMETLFVPFVKGDETGETGIGLAIVEKIVGIYGGTVSVYNNKGACFDFTLKDAAAEGRDG
ncbi:MAG: sensor histidine kinase [Candidatus Geothermincolia bacterium]